MSKKLFLQIREQELLSQERQLPVEYLLTYPNHENNQNQNQRLQGDQRP